MQRDKLRTLQCDYEYTAVETQEYTQIHLLCSILFHDLYRPFLRYAVTCGISSLHFKTTCRNLLQDPHCDVALDSYDHLYLPCLVHASQSYALDDGKRSVGS
jgi:hypothetical protein